MNTHPDRKFYVIDDQPFCEVDCPYFNRVDKNNAKCKLTEKDIDFYDWYLAHCEYQQDEKARIQL